ncbi:uncharacterized protein LOC129752596 [Uranotaenia lowii]|uniref:uncharacterized protein LOC129752596 n=1 Tax=Uranotaenia lowii TaxID=190385 RepID=UPI00247A55B0|nr:uncharacterized protein LOC129752596 [Uranotaenia lowii]
MDVATFGATCSPCAAQFIKNLNAQKHAAEFPRAASAIELQHYVDDYFDSTDSVDEAVRLASEVKLVHSRGGFHIRNFVANSEEFLVRMGEPKNNSAVHFNADKESGTERVLGIAWNPMEDVFGFSANFKPELVKAVNGAKRPTKRIILSCVMSMFDPLGLLTPFTVHGKLLIQDLWRTGCSWDEPIDEASNSKWDRWTNLLPEIEKLKIPRSYFGGVRSHQYDAVELHVFTDASEAAYGCVAYLRVVVDETVRCSLAMSRSKVSPIQQLSIPRNSCRQQCWGSDQRKYSQFVGHRIGEILSNTKLSEWRWVPTKSNVADLLTKWSVGSKLTDDSVWFVGPQFLYETEERWPSQRPPKANVSEKLRAQFLYHDVFIPEPIIDVSRFSKWKKRLNLPIETLKATDRQAKLIIKTFVSQLAPLRREELQKAEIVLFKIAQSEVYADEIRILLKNRDRSVRDWITIEKCSPLYKLTPLLDEEGLIRMEGRTEHGELLPFDMRFPIILPKEHLITAKLTHSFHEKYGHGYRDTVKNELKQRFWIPNVGAVIRKVSKECVWCKVNHNRPQVPRMAPLPYQRVTPYLRPFSYVGVDYLGPVEVTVGRRTEKRWICLFTCLVIRAVHLEVAHSLTSESCLMAIRRFVGRRGPPREFLSDNGTNFKGAFKELQKQIRDVNMECANETTTVLTGWKFNPPATPHMGEASKVGEGSSVRTT